MTETVNVVIGNNIITNANLADVPTNTLKGRIAAGTGDPQDLTADQASTVLDTATDPFVRTSNIPAAPVLSVNGDTGVVVLNAADVGADPSGSAAAAQAAAISAAATDATTKANAAQAASQPLDGDLTAIAALTSNGLAEKTGANTWAIRAIGVGSATDIPTRADADGRYDAAGAAAAAQAASQPLDSDLTSYANAADATARRALIGAGTGNGDALTSGTLAQFAATTSAQLKALISDEMAGLGLLLAFGTSGVEAAYTGNLTGAWTAGVAPSGATNLRQFYTQVGNLVTYQISLTYSVTGTTVTNVLVPFPTEFPTPAIPTGFTGASVKLYIANSRFITTPSGTTTGGGQCFIQRNSGDTSFEIAQPAVTSGSYRTYIVAGSYFTS